MTARRRLARLAGEAAVWGVLAALAAAPGLVAGWLDWFCF